MEPVTDPRLTVGDLGINAERLRDVVKSLPECSTLVDLGVRLGVSSRILLTGAEDKRNWVYGVEAIGQAPELADILTGRNYTFISGDDVTTGLNWGGGDVHLAMFDTFHFAEHILCQLYAWWPHIAPGGWCVFHDTNWPENQHDTYAGMVLPHVIEGVHEFFAFSLIRSYPESYGMVFVQKEDDTDLRQRISPERWREVFAVRRKVMESVNLPGNGEGFVWEEPAL